MEKIRMVLFAGVIACVAAACNTTRGVGQDIEATGDAIEDAAEGAKRSM